MPDEIDGADTSQVDADVDTDSTTEPDSDEALAEAGRKALQQEREATKEAKRALSPWRKLEREFQMGPDEIRAALDSRGDVDKEREQIRREAEAAALSKVNARLVRAECKALATARFADPSDAYRFVDLDDIEVDDDGEVDTKALQRALDDVLREKPYLAKREGPAEEDSGFDGGARTTVTRPTSMTDLIRDAVNTKRGVGAKR